MGKRTFRKSIASLGIFALLVLVTFVLVRCNSSSPVSSGAGSANVTITDPPSCSNSFQHVYVTVTGVMAHTSASAAPSAAGWQNLTTQLSLTSPMQLDLLHLSSSPGQTVECLLKQLGSTQSLPAGSYQQIRLILANNGSGAPTISDNSCASGVDATTVNCVEDSGDNWYPLELSSQDQTGLKIPPGQIVGGPIQVAAGKSVDININFNTCASLAPKPAHGAYRLNPTLTASQVSQNTTGISGTVVAGTPSPSTGTPTSVTLGSGVGGATVKLEWGGGPTDTANGNAMTNLVYDTAVTDANGNFDFCPVNDTATFDVVADAPAPTSDTPPPTAGATIIQNVPNGAKISVPILPQTGLTTTPGTISVALSADLATGATTPFDAYVDLLPLQFTSASGYEFIVPRLNGSDAMPVDVNCTSSGCTVAPATPNVVVPATNPLVGSFSSGSINWSSIPAVVDSSTASTGMFAIEATSATGNDPAHTCDVVFTPQTSVTAGTTPTSVTLTLTNCK